jgi:hypothetical protein
MVSARATRVHLRDKTQVTAQRTGAYCMRILLLWRWRQQVPLIRWKWSTKLHGVTWSLPRETQNVTWLNPVCTWCHWLLASVSLPSHSAVLKPACCDSSWPRFSPSTSVSPANSQLLTSAHYWETQVVSFFLVSWGWVHLVRWPLLILLYQPRMVDDECGAVGGMRIGRRNRSTRRKPAPMPFCPPQTPHVLTSARTRVSTVGSRRLIAWAMARSGGTSNFNIVHHFVLHVSAANFTSLFVEPRPRVWP